MSNQKSKSVFPLMYPVCEKFARDIKPLAVLLSETGLTAHSTAVHECLDFTGFFFLTESNKNDFEAC